jgi:hypothetical protein
MLAEQRTLLYDAVETKAADGRNFDFAFAQRQRRKGLMLQVPIGLVVSSDQVVRRQLARYGNAGLPQSLLPVWPTAG